MSIRYVARFVVPFALAAGPLACGGSVAAEPAASAGSPSTRAPVARNTHGPVKLVGEALTDVPLTAIQRAQIETMAAEAEARHATTRSARRDLMVAIAGQVRSGAIDRTALQPKIDALVAAARSTQPADRAAFEQLHAILEPDQRKLFVDALEARWHDRMGATNAKHPMKQWAEDLKLSDEQRAQIRAALQQHFAGAGKGHDGGPHGAEGKRRAAQVLDAFKKDRLLLDEVAPAHDGPAEQGAKASERFLGMAEVVLPMLTPEQRAIAAQKLEERSQDGDVEGAGQSLLP
jgi:Spy/CpxP family protein refolding chaperone